MGLLNDQGELLASRVQQGLVRAGMKDVTTLSVEPAGGHRLILRHGPSLYRLHVHPVERTLRTPEEEPGWLPFLVSTRFDDPAVDQLANAGVAFLDDLGNTNVSLDGRTVVFARAAGAGRTSVRGTADPPPKAQRAAGALALNRASHRVVFALLANPDLAGGPVRALAAAAGVSVGTVHNTLAQLTDAGHLLEGRLHHTGRLLDAWTDAYRRLTVRPLTARAMYAPDGHWADTARLDPTGEVLLGGIAAAAALDDRLRTTDGIVYAANLGPAVTLLRLTSATTPFHVDVRERFWGVDLPSSQPGLVPSVLIYGDLLRDRDARALDIAASLRRNDAHLRALAEDDLGLRRSGRPLRTQPTSN